MNKCYSYPRVILKGPVMVESSLSSSSTSHQCTLSTPWALGYRRTFLLLCEVFPFNSARDLVLQGTCIPDIVQLHDQPSSRRRWTFTTLSEFNCSPTRALDAEIF